MKLRAIKFGAPLSIFILAYFAFTNTGWIISTPMLYAFAFIPLVELVVPAKTTNLSTAEEEMVKKDRLYDYWLYLIVPIQYCSVYFFLQSTQVGSLTSIELIGRIFVMGLLCGTFGINVGHELGHRKNLYERNLAKALLLSSLYMHFYIEHNQGHHKNVSTKEDPSSARRGEPIYLFYFRTIILGYFSAWKIAATDQRKKSRPIVHFSNQMIQFQFLQLLLISIIFILFGWKTMLYFIAAASIGFLLLETVNYIEHYGLERTKNSSGNYERTLPIHSWNSNHILGRLMLFELSRHSDHHYMASRKYQLLRHHENAPQMPTGYPGMMILSLIPPIWFSIMNKRIDDFQLHHQEILSAPK